MRALRIYSGQLSCKCTAVFIAFVTLYIIPLVLIYLISGNLYFLIDFIQFPLTHPLPLVTTNLAFSCEFVSEV